MPIKWKIFRIANYLLLLTSLGATGLVSYLFFGNNRIDAAEFFYYFLFAGGGLVLIINYSINIYLLERFYPDAEISKTFSMFMAIILSLGSVTIAFLTLTYIVELNSIFESPYYDKNHFSRVRITFISFGMILLISYYVFWMQVALRKTIRRNWQELYATFLDPK